MHESWHSILSSRNRNEKDRIENRSNHDSHYIGLFSFRLCVCVHALQWAPLTRLPTSIDVILFYFDSFASTHNETFERTQKKEKPSHDKFSSTQAKSISSG